MLLNRQNYRDNIKVSGCLGFGVGWGVERDDRWRSLRQ